MNLIDGLNEHQEIQAIVLQKCKIREISNLHNLPNLELLDLSRNKLQYISGLDNLPNLKVLNLTQNNLRRIEGLDNLEYLQKIILEKNKKIREISGFAKNEYLHHINIEKCQVQKKMKRYFPTTKKGKITNPSKVISYCQTGKLPRKKMGKMGKVLVKSVGSLVGASQIAKITQKQAQKVKTLTDTAKMTKKFVESKKLMPERAMTALKKKGTKIAGKMLDRALAPSAVIPIDDSGFEFEEEKSTGGKSGMVCIQCGVSNPDGSVFCVACGNPIN